MVKKCFFCGSVNVVRNGLRGRKQQYKCKDCGRQFLGGIRRDKSQVISEYIDGKQTRKQLAAKYGVSVRTIERDLEGMRYVQKVSKDRSVVIQNALRPESVKGQEYRNPNGYNLLGQGLRAGSKPEYEKTQEIPAAENPQDSSRESPSVYSCVRGRNFGLARNRNMKKRRKSLRQHIENENRISKLALYNLLQISQFLNH